MNAVYGANQPEYQPLPAYKAEDGTVTTCWQLEPGDLEQIQETGVIWLQMLTFNKPLQPVLLQSQKPISE